MNQRCPRPLNVPKGVGVGECDGAKFDLKLEFIKAPSSLGNRLDSRFDCLFFPASSEPHPSAGEAPIIDRSCGLTCTQSLVSTNTVLRLTSPSVIPRLWTCERSFRNWKRTNRGLATESSNMAGLCMAASNRENLVYGKMK